MKQFLFGVLFFCSFGLTTMASAEDAFLLMGKAESEHIGQQQNIATTSFSDVSLDSWQYNVVSAGVQEGIMNGYGNNTFGPDATVTRAEALKAIITASSIPYGYDEEFSFADIEPSEWYAPYFSTAKKMASASGNEIQNYAYPNQYVTRAEATKFILKIFQFSIPESVDKKPFSDVEISSWYAPYIAIAGERSIVLGATEASYYPNKLITRSELLSFIFRARRIAYQKDIVPIDTEKAPFDISLVPENGVYLEAVLVSIGAKNESHICYTTNGKVPACSSSGIDGCSVGSLYSEPFYFSQTGTVKAIACNASGSSDSIQHSYFIENEDSGVIGRPGLVDFSPSGGTYYRGTYVYLKSYSSDIICYSTSDSYLPRCSSDGYSCASGTRYTRSLYLNGKRTVTAVACNASGDSDVRKEYYSIRYDSHYNSSYCYYDSYGNYRCNYSNNYYNNYNCYYDYYGNYRCYYGNSGNNNYYYYYYPKNDPPSYPGKPEKPEKPEKPVQLPSKPSKPEKPVQLPSKPSTGKPNDEVSIQPINPIEKPSLQPVEKPETKPSLQPVQKPIQQPFVPSKGGDLTDDRINIPSGFQPTTPAQKPVTTQPIRQPIQQPAQKPIPSTQRPAQSQQKPTRNPQVQRPSQPVAQPSTPRGGGDLTNQKINIPNGFR